MEPQRSAGFSDMPRASTALTRRGILPWTTRCSELHTVAQKLN